MTSDEGESKNCAERFVQLWRAGDGCQRPLRFSFQPRLTPSVGRPKGGGKHTSPGSEGVPYQDNVHRVQDKVLHCGALSGIIVVTTIHQHPTRRREPCSIRCEPSCAKAKL